MEFVSEAFTDYLATDSVENAMSGAGAIKMLSIDDKTVTTDLDRAGYRKMGVFVRAAANFDEAMKLLQKDKIDLIVINLDYKPVDGLQITKHLKSLAEYKTIPVVLTSVQTAAKVRNNALEAGADLFVEQPLPRQYFIEKLKQLLEHSTRSTERVALDLQVNFEWKGKLQSCPIGDLSISGMLITTELSIPPGTNLNLEFEIPDGKKKAIKVEGEVVRSIKQHSGASQTGLGVKFTSLNQESHTRLEKFVEISANSDARMKYYL